MSCQSNPPSPAGYTVWKGPVPTELTQWAMDLRDHVSKFPYGQTWTLEYKGQTVLARKDYHTWTYRGGQLLTGICIPGITLYQKTAAKAQSFSPTDQTAGQDPLAGVPDPDLAVYGADDGIDWSTVAWTAGAVIAVVAAFVAAVRYAGR